MNLDEYIQNFVGYTIPSILVELLIFANNCPTEDYFSEGFEFIADGKCGLESWSSAPQFLDRLVPFALADGNGSFYAFWVQEDRDLNRAPIVVFGPRKSFYLVAQNLLEFLQLISLDVEPMVDADGVNYCRDEENYEPSPHSRKYKNWLRQHFNLCPISNNFAAEQIVDDAQENYQDPFWHWMTQFRKRAYCYN